ncbi:MAG TPA: hypothetical protein VGE51_15185 [Fontimonas sp.]
MPPGLAPRKLAQIVEVIGQQSGLGAARQFEGARTALQRNLGIGGACVVTLSQRS